MKKINIRILIGLLFLFNAANVLNAASFDESTMGLTPHIDSSFIQHRMDYFDVNYKTFYEGGTNHMTQNFWLEYRIQGESTWREAFHSKTTERGSYDCYTEYSYPSGQIVNKYRTEHSGLSGTQSDYDYVRWYVPENLQGKTFTMRTRWEWGTNKKTKESSSKEWGLFRIIGLSSPSYTLSRPNPGHIGVLVANANSRSYDGKGGNLIIQGGAEKVSFNAIANDPNNPYQIKSTKINGKENLNLTFYYDQISQVGVDYSSPLRTHYRFTVSNDMSIEAIPKVTSAPTAIYYECEGEGTNGAVELQWKRPNAEFTSKNPYYYTIYRSESSDFKVKTQITTVPLDYTSLKFKDISVLANKTYYYKILAIPTNEIKSQWATYYSEDISSPSGSVSTKQSLKTIIVPRLSVTSDGKAVEIQWDPKDFCSKGILKIKRYLVDGTSTSISLDFLSGKYIDKAVDACVNYEYAFEYTLYTQTSFSEKSSILLNADVEFLSFTATKGEFNSSVRLNWDVKNGSLVSDFAIYRKLVNKPEMEWELQSQISKNVYVWTDDKPINKKYYQYVIRANYTCGGNATPSFVQVATKGFCMDYGTVAGTVSYASGNTVIKDVLVSAIATDGNEKDLMHASYFFPPEDAENIPSAKINCKEALDLNNAFTWQAYLLPVAKAAGTATVFSVGDFSIVIKQDQGSAVLECKLGTNIVKSQIDSLLLSYHAYTIHSTADRLELYIDGKKVDAVDKSPQQLNTSSTMYLGNNSLNNEAYIGWVDELVIWETNFDSLRIHRNAKRYIMGSESNIFGLWTFDESIEGEFFDMAKTENIRHDHDGTSKGVRSSDKLPSKTQLALESYTREDGTYEIKGLPFEADGSSYSISPAYGTHQFNPAEQKRFVAGNGAQVQNKVDFYDQSYFSVNGTITFHNTQYPSEKVEIHVDGMPVVNRDGSIAMTDAEGNFKVDVPLGPHYLSAVKNGHVFAQNGRFPADSFALYNFQESMRINFVDSTLVQVLGRVCGGSVEQAKEIGFGLSKANIGQATIVLQAAMEQYPLMTKEDIKNGVPCYTYDYTANDSLVSSRVKVGLGEGSYNKIEIYTDAKSGEYVAWLPPIKFNVSTVTTNTALIPVEQKVSYTPDPTKQKLAVVYDTALSPLPYTYNERYDYIYRSPKLFSVKDQNYGVAFGDQIGYIQDQETMRYDTLTYFVYASEEEEEKEEEEVAYGFGYPVYTQNNVYGLNISAYERYVNNDDFNEQKVDEVPVTDGIVRIDNKLGYESTTQASYSEIPLDSMGRAYYTFVTGEPNFTTGRYPLSIDMRTTSDGAIFQWNNGKPMEAYIFGQVLRGSDFITKGPDLISYVLRDPPGSNSFATAIKGVGGKVTTKWGYAGNASESLTMILAFGKAIIKTTMTNLPAPVPNTVTLGDLGASVDVSLNAGLVMSQNWEDSHTSTIQSSINETFSTSPSPIFVGTPGDIFVGLSTNIFMGSYQVLSPLENIDPDTTSSTLFVIGSSGKYYEIAFYPAYSIGDAVKTMFIYSQNHIQYNLMPDLISQRNTLLKRVTEEEYANPENLSGRTLFITKHEDTHPLFGTANEDPLWREKPYSIPTTDSFPSYKVIAPKDSVFVALTDTVSEYNATYSQWEQVLAANEFQKMKSLKKNAYTNVSIATGASYTSTQTYVYSETAKNNFDFKYNINVNLATDPKGMQTMVKGLKEAFSSARNALPNVPGGVPGVGFDINGNQGYSDGNGITHVLEGPENNQTWRASDGSLDFQDANTSNKFTKVNFLLNISGGGQYFGSSGSNVWEDVASDSNFTLMYNLSDANPYDYYSIDIDTLPEDGFGPIFRTRAGRTACPHQAEEKTKFVTKYYADSSYADGIIHEGTVQIEQPVLQFAQNALTNIPSGREATVHFTVSNNSPVPGFQEYSFSLFSPNSNASGLELTVDGAPFPSGLLYTLGQGESITKTLKIKQSRMDIMDYKGLQFGLASTCQAGVFNTWASIVDMKYLDVQFVPSCSDLKLNLVDGTTLNDLTPKHQAQIEITDYDSRFFGMQAIFFEYKGKNNLDFVTKQRFILDSALFDPNKQDLWLNPATIQYAFDMKGFADGEYQIRATSMCKNGSESIKVSTPVQILTKDVQRPTLLGSPLPANGVLGIEDNLGVNFNESINPVYVIQNNVEAWTVPNQSQIEHNVGLDFDGEQAYAQTEAPFSIHGHSFSVALWLQRKINKEGVLFSHGQGEQSFSFGFTADNKLYVQWGENERFLSSQSFTDSLWQYLSFSYNKSEQNIAIYLMSDQFSNADYALTAQVLNPYYGQGSIFIGQEANGNKKFKGNIAELSLWDIARTKNEIQIDNGKRLDKGKKGLISYWPMDEGYGSIAKDLIRQRHLKLHTPWYLYPQGYALNTQSEGYLKIPINPHLVRSINQDFTLEFWFSSNQAKAATLVSCGKGDGSDVGAQNQKFSIALDSLFRLHLFSNGKSFLLSQTPVDSAWHHLALSIKRGTNASFYLDGQLEKQIEANLLAGIGEEFLILGACLTSGNISDYFNGKIDEFRLWGSALPLQTIRKNAYQKLNGLQSDLLAYYPFERWETDAVNASTSLRPCLINQAQKVLSPNTDTAQCVVPAVLNLQSMGLKDVPAYIQITAPAIVSSEKLYFDLSEIEPYKLEDCQLDLCLSNIKDMYGNPLVSPIRWTALVNRAALVWTQTQINTDTSFKVEIRNRTSKVQAYSIEGMPSWMTLVRPKGTLAPQENLSLYFSVDPYLAYGLYEGVLKLTGEDKITKNLPYQVYIEAPKPDWNIDSVNRKESMNLMGKIKIKGHFSENPKDILAAFEGNTCVGIASPVYISDYQAYYVFMDLFAKEGSVLQFKLWEANTGTIYPHANMSQGNISIPFIEMENNAILGSWNNPICFENDERQQQDIPLSKAWNWVSFNVSDTNYSSAKQYLGGLGNSVEAIKSQTEYLLHQDGNWQGDLDKKGGIEVQKMYKILMNKAQTLSVVGKQVELSKTPISLNMNWNWLAYLPSVAMTIEQAFSGFEPTEGDLIKSPNLFAIYSPLNGWEGNLNILEPGHGYMYRAFKPKEFYYPTLFSAAMPFPPTASSNASYPNTLTMLAVLSMDSLDITDAYTQVEVYVNGERRAYAQATFVESIQAYRLFISVSGMEEGDELSFKLLPSLNSLPSKQIEFHSNFSSLDKTIVLHALRQNLLFGINKVEGSIETPIYLEMNIPKSMGENTSNTNIRVYPNPCKDFIRIKSVEPILKGELSNLVGVVLATYSSMPPMLSMSHLPPGMYLLKVETQKGVEIIKINKQ